MNKVAVTGGTGFIGSHIVEELVEMGVHVIAIDNLSYGNINNIKHLLEKKNLEYIQGNINDFSLLQKLFSGSDYVFHHAAIPYPLNTSSYISYYQENSNGILNVLQAAKDNNIKKVIFASSSAVYGDNPAIFKREDMIPNPQSPYSITKLIAENYCSIFTKFHGLPTVCLRYFNVYGPRQSPNSQLASVIPKFIQRVLEGKSPIIFGDGEQSRDFVFVRDVVMANLLAAESDAVGVFNIGKGESITLNALAAHIINLAGINVEPIYEKPIPGDIQHSLADISRARTFGYQPKYSLEDGLQIVLRSFLQNSHSLLSTKLGLKEE